MPWLLSSLYVSDVILRRREIPRGWEIPSHPSSNPTLPIGIAAIVAEFQIDVNKIDQEGLDFSDDVCYSKFLEQQNRKMEGELMHKQIQATIRSLTILVTVSTLAGCVYLFGGSQLVDEEQVAVIATEKGKIVIELYPDSAPATVENFQKLIRKKFYDWLTFHRKEVTVDLNIIQGGDPEGNGRGGPGYTIIDESTPPPKRNSSDGAHENPKLRWQSVLYLPQTTTESRRSVHDIWSSYPRYRCRRPVGERRHHEKGTIGGEI